MDALESGNKRRTSNFLGTTETTGLLDRNEFVSFVELLNNQLAKYWKDDQRVAVVKLVIQIVKILATPGRKIGIRLSLSYKLYDYMNNFKICANIILSILQMTTWLRFILRYSFYYLILSHISVTWSMIASSQKALISKSTSPFSMLVIKQKSCAKTGCIRLLQSEVRFKDDKDSCNAEYFL